MKKLLFFTSSGVAVLALLFAGLNIFETGDAVAVYKPRSAQKHIATNGAQGAMEYMQMLKKNFYTGQVELSDIIETRKALQKYSANRAKSNDMGWNSLGPDNIGGRTRALWLNPDNNNHLIGGGVSGGLWQTFNAGNTWEPILSFNKHEDFFQHMPIASINRTGSGIYYVGTGSQHEYFNWSGAGTAGFVGGGLFRSTDTQGTDWELVLGPEELFNSSPFQEWITVDRIMVDPNNPEKLWIAHSQGLDVFIHGNGNDDVEERPNQWPFGLQPCEDVQISHDGQVIVASISSQGYISTDGGQTFNLINSPLTNGESNILSAPNNSRLQFAISPTDADYIYAAVVNQNQSLKGVVATFNRGESWTRIAADVNASTPNQPVPFQPFGGVGGQGRWDCALSVNPLDPKHIFLGGLVIYSHKIVGNVPSPTNWEQRSLYSTNYLNPFAVHPDVHWFVWDQNNIFYACTDGGFFKSNDMATSPAPTFYASNQGYVTTQFYGIDHANDGRTIGGTQDNGTLYQNLMGVTPNQSFEVFGGDGFDCAISAVRPNLLFGSSQNGVIYRSLGGSFGEVISPGPSTDFTTDLRLIETENDPYSTRGTMWGVDTIYDGFVPEYMVWPNGDITLGYIPAGFIIQYNSSADQRELWEQTEENMYYYAQTIQCDSIFIPTLDTVDVVENLIIVDSLLTDTTYVFDCDTLNLPVDTTYAFLCDTLNIPMDTTFVDTCTIFQEQIFCVTIDTTYSNFQDTLFCVVSDTTVIYLDTVVCNVIDTTYTFNYIYDTTYTYITEEVFDVFVECDTLFNYSDSLLLIDPVQSLLVVGLGQGNGVWVTRDALNTGIDPDWWLVNNTGQMVNALEWSPDRNHLYIGTTSGQLLRVSGFNQVYHANELDNLTTTTLISSGAPITDIAVDYSEGTGGPDSPPASSMVVVSRANYGFHSKILRSFSAATTTSNNTFQDIWNIQSNLSRMPAYSCVIEKDNPDIILLGTELGVFRTDDGGTTWVEANGGAMDRAPVFDLRQQYREPWHVENSGVIYAGTHGRGIFDNGDFFLPATSVEDNPGSSNLNSEVISQLNIFPNPMNTNGWFEFKLRDASDVRALVFDINGKMVETIVRDKMPAGEHQIGFNVNRLSSGTYILVLDAGGEVKNGRFIVTK